ncbi:unnamed protein product [Rhodiola kirilowii]
MRHILIKAPPPKPASKGAKDTNENRDPKTGNEAVKSTSPTKDAPAVVENQPAAAEPQVATA